MENKINDILTNIRPEYNFIGVNDFFEEEMLDSFDLVTIVAELDKSFSIHIDGLDIIPENFNNIPAIMNLLNKYGVS